VSRFPRGPKGGRVDQRECRVCGGHLQSANVSGWPTVARRTQRVLNFVPPSWFIQPVLRIARDNCLLMSTKVSLDMCLSPGHADSDRLLERAHCQFGIASAVARFGRRCDP
jgi:hypothetical protein